MHHRAMNTGMHTEAINELLYFLGDMLVMAFMMVVVVWVSLSNSKQKLDEAARIPLEDSMYFTSCIIDPGSCVDMEGLPAE